MTDETTPKPPPLLTPEHLEQVALFPLPGAVFFPSTMLPLHIFEPRYRVMTAEALKHGLPIAVVKLREPTTHDQHGRAEFHDVGGVGFIHHHQHLPDGRYNILLEGQSRVRIVEELNTDRPYRVGRAQLLPDEHDTSGSVNTLLTTLAGCIIGLQQDYSRLAEALSRIMANVSSPGDVANTIASVLIADPEPRQDLLEERRIDLRLEDIITRLTDLMAHSPQSKPWLN